MVNPNTQTVEGNQDQEQEQVVNAGTEQATQQEQERLYAGRFKTPEELEEHYKYSSNEGIRLAQEVKRLNAELQQARTPKEQQVVQDKIDELYQYFEPETAKILSNYVGKQAKTQAQNIVRQILSERDNQERARSEFSRAVSENWEETKQLYPEVANPQSKLYQRANEILFERKLAEVANDGTVRLLSPFAYRMAVEAASVELGRQANQTAETQEKKNRAINVQGKTTRNSSSGRLTYEQYLKLSDEEKDAYDQQNIPK